MDKRISFCPKNTNEEERQQIKVAKQIGDKALQKINHSYGSGFPDWKPGQRSRAFHNGYHGRAVGNWALELCTRLGLPKLECAAGQMAGSAHDVIYEQRLGTDEAESAAWLDEQLYNAGIFSPDLREIVRLAILGTVPVFQNGVLVEQQASIQEYPSRNAELIAKSVASADIGALNRPEGPYLAHQLLHERKGTTDNISVGDMIGSQRSQLEMLHTYRYPLEEADGHLATHRPQVIRFSEEILNKLERGEINSWDQLIGHSEAFLHIPH